jgi:hypothetical protein
VEILLSMTVSSVISLVKQVYIVKPSPVDNAHRYVTLVLIVVMEFCKRFLGRRVTMVIMTTVTFVRRYVRLSQLVPAAAAHQVVVPAAAAEVADNKVILK